MTELPPMQHGSIDRLRDQALARLLIWKRLTSIGAIGSPPMSTIPIPIPYSLASFRNVGHLLRGILRVRQSVCDLK